MDTSSGGSTAKTHKSRKTGPVTALADGVTSVSLATIAPTESPMNPVVAAMVAAPAQGGDGQPPVVPAAVDTVPSPEPPARQWWYRPKDSKARKLVEKIVVMDVAGWKSADIAKKLKTTEGSINQYRYIGKKNGWIRAGEDGEPEVVDIEAELAMNVDRKIVRNIDASLDGHMTNWQTHEMTIQAAKGRGIFKGDAAKSIAAGELPVVAIQIIMPPVGVADQRIDETQIGGTPAYYEGEVETEGN